MFGGRVGPLTGRLGGHVARMPLDVGRRQIVCGSVLGTGLAIGTTEFGIDGSRAPGGSAVTPRRMVGAATHGADAAVACPG